MTSEPIKIGPPVDWSKCAMCGSEFKTDSVKERFWSRLGVVCRGCFDGQREQVHASTQRILGRGRGLEG